MANRAKRNSSRYFDEIQSNSGPGKLSKELRKALGLEDDMLPVWIYKMRVLGYPPGWWKQAEIQPNLDIIGDDQAKPKENIFEDGEIQLVEFDESATVEFPGYNAPLPKNVKDDWLVLGYPPFIPPKNNSKDQSKPKISSETSQETSDSIKNAQESIQNSSSSSELSQDTKPISQETTSSINSEVVESEVVESEVVDSEVSNKEDSEVLNSEILVSDSSDEENSEVTAANSSVIEECIVEELDVNSSSITNTNKRKITVIQGEAVDSYQFKRKKLPDLSKWAEGVSGDLLNYENLPNAGTGNLKKIRDLLSTFRNKKNDENQN